MSKKELISKWLSLFGDSHTFLLPDIKWSQGIDWSLANSLDDNINANTEAPFWLYFTPNWNFWRKQTIWEKLVRKASEAEKYISCFFFDIDIKSTDFQSVDEAFEKTIEILKERNLRFHFLTKSWGWVHGYIFVEPSQRYNVWEAHIRNFNWIMKTISEFFPWWDPSVGTIERLMRLPFSQHWKTWIAIPVSLYRLDWEESLEVVKVKTPEDIVINEWSYLQAEHITSMASSIKEDIDVKRHLWWKLSLWTSSLIDHINKIPIGNILNNIKKYPRINGDISTQFVYKNTFISFIHTNIKTWEVTEEDTMWYRIWEDKNCVNNFTNHNHDIYERPRGWPYSFLYYYFHKDIIKINEFLKTEFKIQFEEKSEEYMMPTIVSSAGIIQFTKTNVIYKKEQIDNKWKIHVVNRILFDSPIVIKGIMESKYSLFWEKEHSQKYYILHRPDAFDDKDVIIDFNESRSKFNQKYGGTWLVFKGQEEDLLDFYVALNHAVWAWQISKYELRYLNGFYPEYFLLGNTFISPSFSVTKEWESTILKTQKVDVITTWREYVTAVEFYEIMCKIFSKRVTTLSLLTYMALFLWNNFWEPIKKVKQQFMMPGLILSGLTRVGKSTLISILKEGSGISIESKRLAISATMQPLRQMATDAFIVHYDEFTGVIPLEKEHMIRDILNKANSARWTITGDNINYHYRASIMIDWERLPASASVLNRMIAVPMFEEDKLWNEGKLEDIRHMSYMKDLITTAYKYVSEESRIELFRKAEEALIAEWIVGRNLMLNTYLYAMAMMLGFKNLKEIASIIKFNVWVIEASSTQQDELSSVLSDAILTKRFIPVKRYSLANGEYTIEVPLTSEFINEKSVHMIAIQKKYPNITLYWNRLTIIIPENDNKMMGLIDHYEQYFRNETIIKDDKLKIPLSPNSSKNAVQSSAIKAPRDYSGYT